MVKLPPQEPLFVFEGQDLGVYATYLDAENHLEPRDVRAGIFDGYDALGRKLAITTDGRSTLVELKEDKPSEASLFEYRLRRALGAWGEERASASDCDLPCLLELAARYAH